MPYPFDADMARAFLEARYPDLEPGERIELRTIDQRGEGRPTVRQYWGNIGEVVEYARGVGEGIDIYVGINPRLGAGGHKSDVSRIATLWADLDGKRGGMESSGRVSLPGSMVVESSRGSFQGYWFLQPIDAQSNAGRVERLLARLYDALGGLDATQDISRVFRLPGSWNWKKEYPQPFQVRVAQHDPSAVYTIEQFEALLPPLPEEPPRTQSHAGELFLLPLPSEVSAILDYIPAQQNYNDWIKVLAGVHDAYPDETGVELCEAWSPGYVGEIEHKFRSFRRGEGQSKATFGSVIHLAKQYGYVPPKPPTPTMIKRQTKEPGWRNTLAELGPLDRNMLPARMEPLIDYCGPAVDVLPLDYTVGVILSFLSPHLGHLRFENLGPQSWLLGIFKSSSAKGIVSDGVNDIFEAFPADNANPLTFYTSGTPEGIWKELDGENRRLMAYIREFGGYIAGFSRDHMAGARDAWCNLYDGATIAHILARSKVVARKPLVAVVGTCTPDHITAHVSPLDLGGGYLNRFLVIAGDDRLEDVRTYPDPRKAPPLAIDLYNHLVTTRRASYAAWDTQHGEWVDGDPAAYAALKRRLGIGTGRVRRFEDDEDIIGAPGRVAARAKKLGMLLEVMEFAPQIVGDTIMVREKNIALACQLALRSGAMFEGMASLVNQGADQQMLGKIRRVLSEQPGKQASKRYLMQRTRANIKQLTTCLGFLEEEGEVLPVENSRGLRNEWRLVS